MSTLEVTAEAPRPSIRLRPVPRCEPPFDDELEPQRWVTANQLAFEWPKPPPKWESAAATEAEPPPPAPPSSNDVAQGSADHSGVGAGGSTAARQDGGTSGDAKLAVRRFVKMCVEVLNGYRPAAHLRQMARPKDAAAVVAQAVAGTGRVAEIRQGGGRQHGIQARIRRPRMVNRRDRGPGPVAVLRLQLCEPRAGAVEATILLVTGERTWAMALRMERHQQAWAATALRLV